MNPYQAYSSHSQQHIERVDEMIRENNKKYIDQKSQIEYQRALQHYEKQRKRQALKQYAQNIKEGNKKAIQKKLRQSSISKNKTMNNNKNKNNNRSSSRLNSQMIKDQSLNSRVIQGEEKEIVKIKQKQKMSQKQIKKVQKAIQARAQRHLQELQLQKLNKKLQQQKKRTKLFELKQTCQKVLSKSHKRIPPVSQKIPQSRKVILQQYSKKAQQQVNQLDNIIAGLMHKAKQLNNQNNQNINNNPNINSNYQDSKYQQQSHKVSMRHLKQRQQGINQNNKYPYSEKNIRNNNLNGNQHLDVFSEQFEIQFMNQVLSKGLNVKDLMTIDNGKTNKTNKTNSKIKSRGVYSNNQNDNGDVLFTKSAKELFSMNYIPINNNN